MSSFDTLRESMRVKSKNDHFSVHAIAGTHVVLLAMDVTKAGREGLLGFAIERTDAEGSSWLRGGRLFEGQEVKKGDTPDSRTAPIQAMMWSDFRAEPGKTYGYTVHPVYGCAESPELGEGLSVEVQTEDPEEGVHGIYFNRAVAGSQSYSRRFGKHARYYPEAGKSQDGSKPTTWWPRYIKPEDVPKRAAYSWLSRGLEEAMLRFIRKAKGKRYSLRCALYELSYDVAAQALVDSLESGADVKVVYHAKRVGDVKIARRNGSSIPVIQRDGTEKVEKNKAVIRFGTKDSVTRTADRTMASIGVRKRGSTAARDKMMIERTNVGALSHNKFMVLLEDGKPIEVWTGSTNVTEGGIFGQSNVGHLIRDERIAQAYFDYWTALSEDPEVKDMRKKTIGIHPDLEGKPPKGMTPIFSPRPSKAEMLAWYGERAREAKKSVHLTAAFGVGGLMDDFATDEGAPIRYILMESRTGSAAKKSYAAIKEWPKNKLAWGDRRERHPGDDHLVESLTGLNTHVSYVHTKYMLIDALTKDPIVISGSANFSKPSTVTNDENMVIIRGDTRVADIFVTEFMRFFKHFQFRNEEREAGEDAHLEADDSWLKPYFKRGTTEYAERMLYR